MKGAHLLHKLTMEVHKKSDWKKEQVLDLINKIRKDNTEVDDVVMYDIFSMNIFGLPHPAVVFKIGVTASYAIVLSSKDKEHSIYPSSTRGMKSGFFTQTIVNIDNQYIMENWIGVYQDKSAVKAALEILKKKYKEIFKISKDGSNQENKVFAEKEVKDTILEAEQV